LSSINGTLSSEHPSVQTLSWYGCLFCSVFDNALQLWTQKLTGFGGSSKQGHTLLICLADDNIGLYKNRKMLFWKTFCFKVFMKEFKVKETLALQLLQDINRNTKLPKNWKGVISTGITTLLEVATLLWNESKNFLTSVVYFDQLRHWKISYFISWFLCNLQIRNMHWLTTTGKSILNGLEAVYFGDVYVQEKIIAVDLFSMDYSFSDDRCSFEIERILRTSRIANAGSKSGVRL